MRGGHANSPHIVWKSPGCEELSNLAMRGRHANAPHLPDAAAVSTYWRRKQVAAAERLKVCTRVCSGCSAC